MNIDHLSDIRINALRSAIADAEAAIAKIEAATSKTAEVLTIASEEGVEVVGLGRKHEILDTGNFPYDGGGSIFTPHAARINGWPAAWRIAERAGIGYGCGNTGQHQIHSEQVIDGVYRCEDGVWSLVESGASA